MNINRGDNVRIVEMNGCMAHRRENSREGVVLNVRKRTLYGSNTKYLYATIRLDSGEVVEKPAEPVWWNFHNGRPEYEE